MNEKEKSVEQKNKTVTFRRLSWYAFPEMLGFQVLAGIILAFPAYGLIKLIYLVAGSGGPAVTTATLRSFILSWRFPVIVALGLILILLYLVIELFAQIHLTDDIVSGKKSGIISCIVRGFQALPGFMNPAGISIIVFIFLVAPICGVGFSISLTEKFYIPNFMMDAVLKKPLFAVGFFIGIAILIWLTFRMSFVLHAILIDKMPAKEAKKHSASIVMANKWSYLKSLLLMAVVIGLIYIASNLLLRLLPQFILSLLRTHVPDFHRLDMMEMFAQGEELSKAEYVLIGFRSVTAFVVLVEKILSLVITLLCGSYFMLNMNRLYLKFTGREPKEWPERPSLIRAVWKILAAVAVFVLILIASFVMGTFYDNLFTREEPVKIIAHRAGGFLASENSLEGLEAAIEHECYGSEIDTQRTKDGYYIINHDNDFARLTGVGKASQDMTIEEIRELRIKDTSGSGRLVSVAELEEMLEIIKGKEKLFVELKGPTADRQMADDVVKLIREHDCVGDTVLISLDYDLIDYAETTYPEFETGTLIFGSIGDPSKLNCDMIIMEEENATDENIRSIQDAGKMAVAWTVNSYSSMSRFLDSRIDAVITDEIELAESVQAELDERTELEVLEDKLDFLTDD